MDTVTVDAQDLFSQLVTVAYLGKRETRKGLLLSIHEVGEGTIRVWRDWLSKQCESRTFSDHSTVAVHHGRRSSLTVGNSTTPGSNPTKAADPTKDPNILWVNSGDHNVGIRFRVKSQRQRSNTMPLLYSSDVEVAVSYIVQFEGK